MRRILFLISLIIFCAVEARAQNGVRVPITVTQRGTVGITTNVVTIPQGASINFCNAPANAVPCTNKATTYTDATLGTPCATNLQLVLDGTNTCVATPDAQGNAGVWVASGQYAYTITLPGGINQGPYFVTAGGSGGGGGSPGGGNTNVQFNNSAAFGGDPSFTFNNGTKTVTVNNLAATNPVTVPNGGTGLANGTSGGIPCWTASTTLAASAALTINVLPKGGGAGACPTNSNESEAGGIFKTTLPIGSGTTPTGCLATITDGICFTEGGSTGFTPTAGTIYGRADSTTNAWLWSYNGGAEEIGPLVHGAITAGHCVSWFSAFEIQDSGTVGCGGGGSGTVTSFSSGNLSPLFTTSVATPTTTPALSFTLSNAAANTVFGNPTNGSAAPIFTPNPSVTSVTTGQAAFTCAPGTGTGGVDCVGEGTAPTSAFASGVDVIWGDNANHCRHNNSNNVDLGCLPALPSANAWTGQETHSALEVFANINSILYVGSPTYPTIESGLTANSCIGAMIVDGTTTTFTETANNDIFSGFHSGTCSGSIFLDAAAVVTLNAQMIIPNGMIVKGDYGTQFIAGASFPVGNTVTTGNCSRSSGGVVTCTLVTSQTYKVGSTLVFTGFTSINGSCVVATSSGTSLTCNQTGGGTVASDGTTGTSAISVPLIVLGDTSPFDDGTLLDSVTVNCNDVAGSIGVYSANANENSGIRRTRITKCVNRGIKFEQSYSGSVQNFNLYDNYIVMSTNASVTTSIGAEFIGTVGTIGSARGLDQLTSAGLDSGHKILAGVSIVNAAGGVYSRIHCENATDCIGIGNSSTLGPSNGTTINGVVGNSAITNTIHFFNVASTRNMNVLGVDLNGGTNSILDSINSITLTDADVGFYNIGNDGKPFTSSTNALSFLNGGLASSAGFRGGGANPASVGVVRCTNTENCVAFRNNANSADIVALAKNTNDQLVMGNHLVPGTNTFQLGVSALPWASTVTNNLTLPEVSSPGGVSAQSIIHDDSTQHAAEVNNNNTGDMPINRTACVNVTPVTVNTSTTADQNLMSCTFAANLLNVVGRTLKVYVAGVYSNVVTAAPTVNVKVKLCTVSGCGSGTVISPISITSTATSTTAVTNLAANETSYITTQTAGASAAFEAHGNLAIDLGTTNLVADSIFADVNTATVGTISSTGQLFLQITAAFSGSSTSNSFTERQLIVEVIN